jgi:hypothetical protein
MLAEAVRNTQPQLDPVQRRAQPKPEPKRPPKAKKARG